MKLEKIKKYKVLNQEEVKIIHGGLNAQSTLRGDLSSDTMTNKKDATQDSYSSFKK